MNTRKKLFQQFGDNRNETYARIGRIRARLVSGFAPIVDWGLLNCRGGNPAHRLIIDN